MKTWSSGLPAVTLFTVLFLSGCTSAEADFSKEPDPEASKLTSSCRIVATKLSEYTAALETSSAGRSKYNPSTMVSFHEGAAEKLTTVAGKLEHDGVKGAVLEVRDASAKLVPVWKEIAANPDTWPDAHRDADVAAANDASSLALNELGKMCRDVNQGDSGISPYPQK